MLAAIAKRFFGTANDRALRALQPTVDAINARETAMQALSDDELRAQTGRFKDRLAQDATLDDLLVDAFATVREAARRTLGERHFDVQLMGGMVLHQGKIAEMKTGEGKTLVATLPSYLNALTGDGVHVVTVNDYLARRDAEWMGQVYNFLGLSVGCIVPGLDHAARKEAYGADISYGTNNEYGFDYLRDNLAFDLDSMVQRGFNFGIVDEVDNILIDEARTPLIISGPTEDNSELYQTLDTFIPRLDAEDFEVDEKAKTVNLTEDGVEHAERMFDDAGLLGTGNLYDIENVSLVHHLNQALKAHKLFHLDTDYIVRNDKVVIIDEFTGRMMEGRRYSDGLHQALEAKENVTIENENQTIASVTFQNYFRLYPKLAGMTGTAMTEAAEFMDIYKLDAIEIPTNEICIRDDGDDEVYRTIGEKTKAIIDLIVDCQTRGQPALVGTVSIEKSEALAAALQKRKVPHKVLNARYHEQEAYIVAQAGRLGGVTIATNMAGRGTDIKLGGNPEMRLMMEHPDLEDEAARTAKLAVIETEVEAEKTKVLEAGGLFVVGTERHESRRIDNQLRGRSGRQGDPGASRFFLSLEDDLMRIFGSERMDGMLQKLGLEEGEAIVHPWINKALEKAQQKVEARNFDIRKNLVKMDDVMNDQRKVIYEQRIDLMRDDDVSETVASMSHEVIDELVARCIPEKAYPEQWDVESLSTEFGRIYGLDLPIADWAAEEGIADEEIRTRLREAADGQNSEKEATFGPELMRHIEKTILLQILDGQWKEHLLHLEHLRQGVGLRAYAQRDPVIEYKQEGFELFQTMLDRLREQVTAYLAHVQVQIEAPPEVATGPPSELEAAFEEVFAGGGGAAPAPARARGPGRGQLQDPDDPSTWGKVGRNQPCPCGSGRKYKHCHGRAV